MQRLTTIPAFVILIHLTANPSQAQQPKDNQVPNGLKALFHPDPKVRYNSAAILGNLGKISRFAVPHLVKALSDKDDFVRLKVAEALWKIDPKLVDYIIPVLRTALRAKNVNVRITASKVVSQLGEQSKPLLSYINRNLLDKDLGVRMETILAIDRLGPAAVNAARPLLQLHKDKDFVLLEPMISVTLGSLGKGAVAVLRGALSDPNQSVRRMAAYGLSVIGSDAKSATGALAKTLEKDKADVKALAAKALGRIGPDAKSALPALTSALKDLDPGVSMNAALAFYRVSGSDKSFSVLMELAKHKTPFVRIGMCRTIGEIGKAGASMRPTLLGMLKDDSPSVRIAAVEGLSKIGPSDDGLVAFIAALQDKDNLVRVVAARGLAKSGDKRAIRVAMPFLKESLSDKNTDVRLQAARAVGEVGAGAKALFKELAVLLEDEDAEVRRATREALLRVDPKGAAELGVR